MEKTDNSIDQSIQNHCFTQSSDFTCNTEFILEQRKQCPFCPNLFDKFSQALIVNRALFLKYSSSQNYYYSREITKYVENTKQKSKNFRVYITNLNDFLTMDDESEYFNDCLCFDEIKEKLDLLTEYYKFHKEIPRIFQNSVRLTLNHYHNRVRRIDYYKIKQILNEDDAEHTSHSSIQNQRKALNQSNDQKKFPNLLDTLVQFFQLQEKSKSMSFSQEFQLLQSELKQIDIQQERLQKQDNSRFYLNNNKSNFNQQINDNKSSSELKTVIELNHQLEKRQEEEKKKQK